MLVLLLSVLLGSPDYRTRDAAAAAMAALATPADLAPLLDHPDPEVRMRAALLMDETGHAELRRFLASFAMLPYIDADPEWTHKGLACYLHRAQDWHRERGLPMGEAAGWPCYRLATFYALQDGRIYPDPLVWLRWLARTECYRLHRRWTD